MDIVEEFGKAVTSKTMTNPVGARRLLLTGWRAQNIKNRIAPGKGISKAASKLAVLTMNAMEAPLTHPDRTAIVSIFTPCELLQSMGLEPYNVEGFSGYLNGTKAEGPFIKLTEEAGIPETLCSYHKVFIGAAENGIMPKPKCIVSTNLVCDANQLTFRRLAEFYKVPHFKIDVPLIADENAVAYVEKQLRELGVFLETVTGKTLDEEVLRENTRRSRRTLDLLNETLRYRSANMVLRDVVSPLYEFVAYNILLGTEAAETYSRLALEEAKNAPSEKGKRIYWVHTIPYWQQSVIDLLSLNEKAHIVGNDFSTCTDVEFDPEKPYEAMARRMVYNSINGPVENRINDAIRRAKALNADGAVWFCHWGCKHTLGGAQLAKKKFEEAGIPLLILDGDGCDSSSGGKGQTSTRLEAFIEMLGAADE